MAVPDPSAHTPAATKSTLVLHILEIVLIGLLAVYATRYYANPDPTLVQAGNEIEWLTIDINHFMRHLNETGRIPWWLPYMGQGQTSIDSPVASFFNPFNTLPVLIFGPQVGVRYIVIVHAILAGIGGWAIGRVMGFSLPARLFLGAIMLARGSMPSVAGNGYFQLGLTQAYLPWTVAAAVAVARYRHSRTPVVLLALAIVLLYFGGVLYYSLPAVILTGALALAFSIRRLRGSRLGIAIDVPLIRRYILGLVLAGLLSSVTSIPVAANYSAIEGHPNEDADAVYEPVTSIVAQLFTPERLFSDLTWSENYDLYTVPLWLIFALFVLFPPFLRAFSRPALPDLAWRVLIVMFLLGIFFLFWGNGTNPIMRWANANLPGIGQWRVLSRLLTVVSLSLAVIVALRFDSLWRAILLDDRGRLTPTPFFGVVGAAIIGMGVFATVDPLENYARHTQVRRDGGAIEDCVVWLRAHYPEPMQTVHVRDSYVLTAFVREKVRFSHRNMSFIPSGMTPTVYPFDLRNHYSRFLIAWEVADRAYWRERGYRVIPGSPEFRPGVPCLMEYRDALPYAFAMPVAAAITHVPPEDPLPSVQTRGLTAGDVIALPHVQHDNDVIRLTVQPLTDEAVVVVVSELAWRGWRVTIDGQPARLESFGQLLGVVLSSGSEPAHIEFRYDPPLLKVGAAITLASALMIALYMLRAERLIPRRRTPPYWRSLSDSSPVLPFTEAKPAEHLRPQYFATVYPLRRRMRSRTRAAPPRTRD
ncbi:MAG: hypothetical protein JNL42_04080 [Anaerolineae bacterium]|nr:hypothetical protein [Anaerolineae bacterium]